MKKFDECWNEIYTLFVNIFGTPSGEECLKKYDYSNYRAEDLIGLFVSEVKSKGFQFGNCYHAHGIGNNNEYSIFISSLDQDGFVIEKKIATFYYCYGIFGGCYVSITNLSNNTRFSFGRAY